MLFQNIEVNDLIKTYKYGKFAKVDIVLEVNGVKKEISIKSENKNLVHIEKIKEFIKFLEKINFN